MSGMSASYIPYHPEQQQLLPSAMQDWLPQGHLAYFINDTVAGSVALSKNLASWQPQVVAMDNKLATYGVSKFLKTLNATEPRKPG